MRTFDSEVDQVTSNPSLMGDFERVARGRSDHDSRLTTSAHQITADGDWTADNILMTGACRNTDYNVGMAKQLPSSEWLPRSAEYSWNKKKDYESK
jgi:hypothetical protein